MGTPVTRPCWAAVGCVAVLECGLDTFLLHVDLGETAGHVFDGVDFERLPLRDDLARVGVGSAQNNRSATRL